MVNLGEEIKNDKKWNEKKLGPCMNVFTNYDPYTTLDLFHPKQWVQNVSNIKEIETWKVANRLWNGKMIKRTSHIPLPDAVTREIITTLAVICAQNQWQNTLKEI